jgi:hypothetical protein
MAGLLAARVCADHCTRVLVLDPDARALAAAACAPGALAHPPPHARVMQHGAPHGLQALYHHALGALFPGRYAAALAAAGAVVGPGSYNSVIGGVPLDVPMDMLPVPAREVAGASRACQEAVLRMLVAQDGRVEFVDGTVVGFEAHPVDGRRLGGVTYRTADDPKAVHKLQGDLIIGGLATLHLQRTALTPRTDCTGAAHAGLALLQRLPAFAVPGSALESYHPHMRYGIGKFQHAHAALAPFFAHTSASERASPFVGSFVPLAGVENRWLALMRIEGDQRAPPLRAHVCVLTARGSVRRGRRRRLHGRGRVRRGAARARALDPRDKAAAGVGVRGARQPRGAGGGVPGRVHTDDDMCVAAPTHTARRLAHPAQRRCTGSSTTSTRAHCPRTSSRSVTRGCG